MSDCIVCLDHRVNTRLVPCDHEILCEQCALVLLSNKAVPMCPLCRIPLYSFVVGDEYGQHTLSPCSSSSHSEIHRDYLLENGECLACLWLHARFLPLVRAVECAKNAPVKRKALLSLSYAFMSKYVDSLRVVKEVVAESPTNILGHLTMAQLRNNSSICDLGVTDDFFEEELNETSHDFVLRELRKREINVCVSSLNEAMNEHEESMGDMSQCCDPFMLTISGMAHRLRRETEGYVRCIQLCTRALRLDPMATLAYNARGNAFADWGNHLDGSLSNLRSAMISAPGFGCLYRNRGIAYHSRRIYGPALTNYNKAIRLNPLDASSYYNRGVMFDRMSQGKNAMVDYTEAVRMNPVFWKAYNNRAILLENGDECENGIDDYSVAILCNPKEGDLWYNRGITYERMKNMDKALRDFSAATARKPTEPVYLYRRAKLLIDMQNYEEAMKDVTVGLEQRPGNNRFDALRHEILHALENNNDDESEREESEGSETDDECQSDV